MAFILNNFSPSGGQSRRGAAPQSFSYRTPDTLGDVTTPAYFNEIRGMLEPHDQITVSVETGGTVAYAIIFVDNVDPGVGNVTINALDINAA